eukprot:5569578-Pleurochrysis_carterae.AAC.1
MFSATRHTRFLVSLLCDAKLVPQMSRLSIRPLGLWPLACHCLHEFGLRCATILQDLKHDDSASRSWPAAVGAFTMAITRMPWIVCGVYYECKSDQRVLLDSTVLLTTPFWANAVRIGPLYYLQSDLGYVKSAPFHCEYSSCGPGDADCSGLAGGPL